MKDDMFQPKKSKIKDHVSDVKGGFTGKLIKATVYTSAALFLLSLGNFTCQKGKYNSAVDTFEASPEYAKKQTIETELQLKKDELQTIKTYISNEEERQAAVAKIDSVIGSLETQLTNANLELDPLEKKVKEHAVAAYQPIPFKWFRYLNRPIKNLAK